MWRNSCRSPSNHKIVLIVSCINTNHFKVENMAFSVFSDLDFFQVLICSTCCSLHLQHRVNNSVRINRAAVQNALQSHHTCCIKICFINLCIGLSVFRAYGVKRDSECVQTKHVQNFVLCLFIFFSWSYFFWGGVCHILVNSALHYIYTIFFKVLEHEANILIHVKIRIWAH